MDGQHLPEFDWRPVENCPGGWGWRCRARQGLGRGHGQHELKGGGGSRRATDLSSHNPLLRFAGSPGGFAAPPRATLAAAPPPRPNPLQAHHRALEVSREAIGAPGAPQWPAKAGHPTLTPQRTRTTIGKLPGPPGLAAGARRCTLLAAARHRLRRPRRPLLSSGRTLGQACRDLTCCALLAPAGRTTKTLMWMRRWRTREVRAGRHMPRNAAPRVG